MCFSVVIIWLTTMVLWQSKPFVLLRAVCCSSLSPNKIYNERHGWFFLKGLNWNLWCRGHIKLTGRQSAKKKKSNSAAAGMSDLVEAWFVKQVKPEILSSPKPELKLPSENTFRISCLLVQPHQVSQGYAYKPFDAKALPWAVRSVSRSWQKKIVVNISLLIFVYLTAKF